MAGDIENSAIPIGGAIALLATIIAGVWKFGKDLSESEKKIVNRLTDAEKRIDDHSSTQRRELVELIDQAGRRFGETVLSVKEHGSKIHLEVTRDYVTKREFSDDFNSIKSDIKSMAERMDDGFNRLHAKLDRAAEWRSHVHKGEPPE